MKDRVPTEVLKNGAVRMERFDTSGNSLGYVWLKRADTPSEVGTPLCKSTLLTDDTASALGLDTTSNPTPNDALAKLASRGEIVTLFDGEANGTHTIELGGCLADFTKLSVFADGNGVTVHLYNSTTDTYVPMQATAKGYSGLHTVDIAGNGLASPINASDFFQPIETRNITKLRIQETLSNKPTVRIAGIRR